MAEKARLLIFRTIYTAAAIYSLLVAADSARAQNELILNNWDAFSTHPTVHPPVDAYQSGAGYSEVADAVDQFIEEIYFAEKPAGAGTIASRLGVIHSSFDAPQPVVFRAGAGGIYGTHTQAANAELGLAGSIPLHQYSYFDYNISQTFGAFSRQWSYEFPGVEWVTSVEAVWRFPFDLYETEQVGFGWRGDWFSNRSWDEVHGRTPSYQRNFSIMGQRTGTGFIQYDWKEPGIYRRLRLEIGNDLGAFGGDNGDKFRTAQARLVFLQHQGNFQYRIGGVLELFVGDTDYRRTTTTPAGQFLVTRNLPFADWSQGFLGLQLGFSWFHRISRLITGEFGVTLFAGPDTESIRDLAQNQFTHAPQGIPRVPLIDRDDRFRFDVRLFYILHFGS